MSPLPPKNPESSDDIQPRIIDIVPKDDELDEESKAPTSVDIAGEIVESVKEDVKEAILIRQNMMAVHDSQ